MVSVHRIEVVRPDSGKNQILLSFMMGRADKDRSAASGKKVDEDSTRATQECEEFVWTLIIIPIDTFFLPFFFPLSL